MIREGLKAVKQNLIYVVVGSLLAGLAFGQVAASGVRNILQAAILPVLFVMIYPMMINIDLREVVNVRQHATVVILTLILNFVAAPLVAIGLAEIFFAGSAAFAIGLYFIALIPTSGMTAAWTGLAGGDLESALVAMSINLLAAIAILPLYLSVLVGSGVGFNPTALYRQLAVIVLIPMLAGVLTRTGLLHRYSEPEFKRLKPLFGGVSSIGVMMIVFMAMSMRSRAILADPLASMSAIVPLIAFYVAILGLASGVGRVFLDTERSVSLVYATSMRNLSIAIAIVAAPGFPPAEAILPIALAYIIQPPLGAVYMHYRRDVVEKGLNLREVVVDFV
jgi:Arsenite efflux pump ACR3 and related permeases